MVLLDLFGAIVKESFKLAAWTVVKLLLGLLILRLLSRRLVDLLIFLENLSRFSVQPHGIVLRHQLLRLFWLQLYLLLLDLHVILVLLANALRLHARDRERSSLRDSLRFLKGRLLANVL